MTGPKSYRWRKTTDINRKNALFELVEDETPVLDVGFTDEGVFEVAFNESIGGMVVEWQQLKKLVEDGKAIAERDR